MLEASKKPIESKMHIMYLMTEGKEENLIELVLKHRCFVTIPQNMDINEDTQPRFVSGKTKNSIEDVLTFTN